jgi:hypothetical protein
MAQKQKQPNQGGRHDAGTDGGAEHRTERGSAGSRLPITLDIEFDPALPRSVLCLFYLVISGTVRTRPRIVYFKSQ